MSVFDNPDPWAARDREAFSGYPDYDRNIGRLLGRTPPPEPEPEDLVALLGAEPIKNGPTAKNHMAYCKQRALEYAPANQPGDAGLAMSSLIQDFNEDERTVSSADIIPNLMLPLAMIGEFNSPGKLRRWILGFN